LEWLARYYLRVKILDMTKSGTVFTLFTIAILIIIAAPVQAQSGPAPVLVYYYAWWTPSAVGPGKSPDWPTTPYDSWDPAVIQQHVSQAASAGIDGLVVAWYGPQEENNQTETNFRMILDQAQANGIKALLSVDLGSSAWFSNKQEIIDGLNYALSVHAQHPAYFRYNGKPVLFFWYQGRYNLSEWADIRQQVDPNHNSIWIAEGAALDTLPTFDGLHMYTISWADNVGATELQWGNSTRAKGGLWVGTAMPGWDNTYTKQSERYVRDRGDGAFLRESFSGAAASKPSMIIITSWNEWWEGTQIEPSNNYGDFYLNLTRHVISEYKSSGAVVSSGSSAPPVQPTLILSGPQPTAPQQSQPQVTQTQLSSPTTPATATLQSPTPTLPPTITPTSTTGSITPAQTLVAEIQATNEHLSDSNQESVRDGSGQVVDKVIVIAGVLAGIIGIGLIVMVVAAYFNLQLRS